MLILILVASLAVAELACRVHDRFNASWWASILWEGDVYRHAAKTQQEAAEWAAQYPAAAYVRITHAFHGRHTLHAARWPT